MSRFVFIANCLSTPFVRAEGLEASAQASSQIVTQWLKRNSIRFAVLPCPEMECPGGGMGRKQHGKTYYLKHGLRQVCTSLVRDVVADVDQLQREGHIVLAFLVMEFSPSCGPPQPDDSRSRYQIEGVFVEELRKAFGDTIPFVGLHWRWYKKMARDLAALLEEVVV